MMKNSDVGIPLWKRLFDKHAFIITIIIFILISIVSRLTVNIHFLDPLGHSLKDYEVTDIYYSQIRDKHIELDTNIVLINVGWPERSRIAFMLDRVIQAEPKVIGLDVIFDGMKEPASDSLLRDVLQRGKDRIIMAKDIEPDGDAYHNNGMNDDFFTEGMQTGFVNFPANESRTIRYFSKSVAFGNSRMNAFGYELARRFDPDIEGETANFPDKPIRIHYTATEEHFIMLDPTNFMDTALQLNKLLKDKIVILGYSGSNEWNVPQRDRYFTPLNFTYTGKGRPDMFGIVLHANVIRMLIDGAYIHYVPTWINFVLAFLICYLTLLLFIWISQHYHGVYHPLARVIQIVQFAVFFFIIMWLFEHYRIKWDFSSGLLALALSVDTQLVYFSAIQYIRRIRQKVK